MKPHPAQPLPAALESAVQRLKLAARDAAQRTVESLGLAGLSALNVQQREQMLAAQFELNRKLGAFALAFNEALDERLIRDLGRRVSLELPAGPDADSMWDSLRLVDDGEVEAQISADRFAMDIAHGCEWELRELDAYLGSVLPAGAAGPLRNPLRPEVVGHALIKGINLLTERAELRKLLVAEIGRSLGALLRTSYAAIVADWRQSGLRPASLAVRRRLQAQGSGDSAHDAAADPHAERAVGGESGYHGMPARAGAEPGVQGLHGARGPHGAPGGRPSRFGARSESGFGDATTGSYPSGRRSSSGRLPGSAPSDLGTVDAGLMSLIRRLAYSAVPAAVAAPGLPVAASDGWGGGPADVGATRPGAAMGVGTSSFADTAPFVGTSHFAGESPGNLIHAHRDELRQAATGALDHMVIDVIGFLFDQILSDPKVPPQMARLLARLQLPVLRAALGDAAFFASRRHPVRRFVNRLATLSASFDDIRNAEAQAFLTKAGALVQEVVEGDFEQIGLYEEKLAALEAFVAQQQAEALDSAGNEAAALVALKEDELRLQQLYAERLAGDLRSVSAPLFVLDFLSRIWSQVLLTAQAQDDQQIPPGQKTARLRPVARELVLSVQPKTTPAQRKQLLNELPRLMLALTEGMELVGWPQEQRRDFFGQLMPAHAEALKSTAGRQLDINLTMRQVDGALSRPPPSRADLAPGYVVPVLRDVLVPMRFSAEEAERIGLVDESSVQWDGQLDINVDELEAQAALAPVSLPGMPEWAVDAEPLTAREMADQVQIGFAYEMHLEGEWHKVRLSHVSPGRSFFIFTRGSRHQKTVSLTHRMLVRLYEAERFRAIETRTLLERATVRARQQLSELAAASRTGHGRLH